LGYKIVENGGAKQRILIAKLGNVGPIGMKEAAGLTSGCENG
jgi:hypothetical protein